MTQIRIEVDLEPTDLEQLERRIADGQFTDLAHAIQRAVRTAVHHWRYEESDEPLIMPGITEVAAPVPRESSQMRYFVVSDESEYAHVLDNLKPEDLVGPANEWDDVYEEWLRDKKESRQSVATECQDTSVNPVAPESRKSHVANGD